MRAERLDTMRLLRRIALIAALGVLIGVPLALAAGADLVGQYLRGILGQPVQPERLVYRADVTMLRHFEEVFEG